MVRWSFMKQKEWWRGCPFYSANAEHRWGSAFFILQNVRRLVWRSPEKGIAICETRKNTQDTDFHYVETGLDSPSTSLWGHATKCGRNIQDWTVHGPQDSRGDVRGHLDSPQRWVCLCTLTNTMGNHRDGLSELHRSHWRKTCLGESASTERESVF